MATETVKSTFITNRDAVPSVKTASKISGGVLREWVATVEAGAGDTSSKYIMGSLPSNARISRIELFSDDVGASGAVDIGIYQTTANGGAVVDQDCFASAVDVNTAALNGSNLTYEAALSTAQIDDIEKMLWEQLNLSADPQRDYDVVITPSTGLATGGTLSLRVQYVID
jgi:hypothetical protein